MPPLRLAAAIFVIVLCVYVTTTGGSYATDLASYEVTKNLVQHGSFAMSHNVLDTEAERGVDGRYYAPVGIGHPVFGVPFYLMSKLVQSALPIQVGKPESIDKAAVVVGSTLAAALCAPVVFLFAWRLTRGIPGALFATFGLAFGTVLWPYSKFGFNAPLATACLLWSTYWTWRGVREGQRHLVVLGGTMLGCALLTRHEMVIGAVPLLAWIAFESGGSASNVFRRLAPFGVPVTIAVTIWMSYNLARFGNPLDTGLLRDPNVRFDTPFLVGMQGLLASPGRSLFLYSPLTLVGAAGLFVLARRDRASAWLFGGMGIVFVLLISRMHQWDGGESYGPRYLVPAIPFLMIPLAAYFPLKPHQSLRIFLPMVFALSVALQLPGVLVDYSKIQNDYARRTDGYSIEMSRYLWSATPLVLNTKAALTAVPVNLRYVFGSESVPAVEVTGDATRRDFSQQFAFSLDFWWLYLFYLGAVPASLSVLLGLLPLLAASWMAMRVRAALRATQGEAV